MSLDPFAAQEPFPQTAAREHFTNREGFIEVFRRYVNADAPAPLKVVMFHGVGGIGKTTLLNKLMDDLAREGARDDDPATPIPYGRFNMEDVREAGQAYRQALLKLRSDLEASAGVSFPRFDVCLSVMLAQEGGDAPPLIRSNPLLYKTFEFAVGMSGLSIPLGLLGAAAAKMMDKKPELEEIVRRAGGTEEVLKLRQRARQSDPALPDELIKRFAQDLADGLPKRPGKACRAVLFFDTFETLWTGGGRVQDTSTLARSLDDWVQTLAMYCLHERVGALVVIGGRDRLQWGDETGRWKPLLDQHLMGGVSAPDAQIFLGKCAVGQPPPAPASPLQKAILRCCDTRRDADREEMACHPFYLALCAEIVLNTRRGEAGVDPQPEEFIGIPSEAAALDLSNRFLKSLNSAEMEHWIKELALTPRFDESVALALDDERFHQNGRASWERLTFFSFLEPQGDGFYRMHKVMRDALRRAFRIEDTQAVHEWYEAHWGRRGETALAFYHRWVQDPRSVRREWKAQHAQALKETQSEAARSLLGLWAEIGLDNFEREVLGEQEWAESQETLAYARYRTPVANRNAALTETILRYRACLDVWKERDYPQEWAKTQRLLGVAYRNLPTGDRGANIASAIACYENALRVYTEQDYPEDWASTQNSLGIAHSQTPTGDRSANLENAIACYRNALRVRTEKSDPYEWAGLQNNLGLVYTAMPGDRGVPLARAIACFNNALTVHTEQAHPQEWARTQNNLGNAYNDLEGGDRRASLDQAIACYKKALTIRTEQNFPFEWAMTTGNLGAAYGNLAALTGDAGFIASAVACFNEVARVYTEQDYPLLWAETQKRLGAAYNSRHADGGANSAENSADALACFGNALHVFTEQDHPGEWAETQHGLGLAWAAQGKADEAIGCFERAARAYRTVGSEAKAQEADAEIARLQAA